MSKEKHPGETLTQPIPADPIATPDPEGKAEERGQKTAEEWAAYRGHFPEFTPGKAPKKYPKAVVAPVHNPKFRHYQEARFLLWGGLVGKEMTLAEYDAAVEAATKHVYR